MSGMSLCRRGPDALKLTCPKTGDAGDGAGIPSRSGGSFSLSISAFLACSNVDMAIKVDQQVRIKKTQKTDRMIKKGGQLPFLMPSAPAANVPTGREEVPIKFLSSEIFSLSSLDTRY